MATNDITLNPKMDPVAFPKIYQILTGVTDEEYYTYLAPAFSPDFKKLICFSVIIKKSLESIIINKQIVANYSSELIAEESFLLDDGVVIKTIDSDKLTWINKTEAEAKEVLKDRELEIYRQLIPQLVNENKNKNLLI